MKKVIFILHFLIPLFVFGQRHSWEGNGISPHAKVGCLNIFVNIIYDVHHEYNDFFRDTTYWAPVSDPALEGVNNTAIPKYLLDWMDTAYVPGQLHGTCTRIYGESSFDSLRIIGDFVVVNLRESTVLAANNNSFNAFGIGRVAINLININGLQTIYGHDKLSDYDFNHDGMIDFMNLLIRNIKRPYADINPGSGYGSPPSQSIIIEGNFYNTKAGTCQCVGDKNFYTNPTGIVIHEISHNLFGGNSFHTSGGNHRETGCTLPFLNIQFGYGLMGAGGSGLVCCNGYERWRMHWKHPQSIDYISARDISNSQSVVSYISKESGNRNFILRDFITYGDVVRIKLPYKDSENSSNQYIWLENHQVGSNNKLDFLQYSNIATCRPVGAAGIYAYYQIGRDTLEGTYNQVWDWKHCDNLKIIPAEGYYDYELHEEAHYVYCVNWDEQHNAVIRGENNPFCGNQDQEMPLFPEETDTLLYLSKEFETWRKYIGTVQDNSLPQLGDTLDAFSTHTKINMGTNPSTCNAKTYHSKELTTVPYATRYIVGNVTEKNIQTSYLTGLSIEMTPIQGTGNILVNIRWDDYDITNDTRWTGKIALKETAILTAGKTIILAQNRTVAQPTRDPETGLFAGRTSWRCESSSYFRQDSASVVRLTEGSSLVFESGSRYELSKGARVEIREGCSLTVREGADVCLKGTVEVDSGGVLTLYDTAKMGDLSRLIVRPGGKLIVDGGTLTSACDDVMWQGIEVVGDRTKRQQPQYQGTVELKNGARIENAMCAIRTGGRSDTVHYFTTGGIISAENTTFRNNRQSVVINSYAYTAPSGGIANYNATFSRCTFTVDNNNLFAANNTGFAEHARLWDVKGVKFKGCSFSNSTTSQISNGRGIYADDAGVYVETYCPRQLYYTECECPENIADYSSFSGFLAAIEVSTTGNPYAVTVDGARFENNGTGVKVNGNHFATITRCLFNLEQYPGHLPGNTGLVLAGCSGYTVEENYFTRTTYPSGLFLIDNCTGISVSNSGISDNSLYRNTFTNLTYGISVVGTNGHHKWGSGLQMTCNSFVGGKYDILLASNATVRKHQGSSTKGADNEFSVSSNNIKNFHNPGAQPISYYCYSGTPNLYPTHYTGLTITTIGNSNSCSSTLCNNGGVYLPLSGFTSQMDAYATAAGGADTDGPMAMVRVYSIRLCRPCTNPCRKPITPLCAR